MLLLRGVCSRWPVLAGLAAAVGAALLAGGLALGLRHAHERTPEARLARVALGASRQEAVSVLGAPSGEKPFAIVQAPDGRTFRGPASVWCEGDCVTLVLYDEDGRVAYKDQNRQARLDPLRERLWFWVGW
jgi:hypothetical protein